MKKPEIKNEKNNKKFLKIFLWAVFIFIVLLIILVLIGRKINLETGLNYQDVKTKEKVDIIK